MMMISHSNAQAMVEAALARATELGIAVSIVVVDGGGLPIASLRMDDAVPFSIQVAEAKAVGSAMWRRDGDRMAVAAKDDPYMFAALDRLPALRLPLIPGEGSRVVLEGKRVVGAIGVAGGPSADDRACADAALARLFALLGSGAP